MLAVESIADAALAVGFARLSSVAVAEHLGVSHTALQRHVGDRFGLAGAALDRMVETASWPVRGRTWQDHLEAEAWAWWRVLRAHPGAGAVLAAQPEPPGEFVRRYTALVRALRGLGLPEHPALLAADMVIHMTADEAHRADLREGGEGRRSAAEWSREIGAVLGEGSGLDRERPYEWFGEKLRLIVAGVEQTVARDVRP